MIRSVLYTFLGAAFTITTAWSLGALVLRRLRLVLFAVEEQLLALLTGSVCLSAIVFAFCYAGLARKSVFLSLGVIVSLIALRHGVRRSIVPVAPLTRSWLVVFGIAFVAMSGIYVSIATPPQLNHDVLMYHLSLIGEAHGFTTGGGAAQVNGFELVLLFATLITRSSAAVLVNFVFLAAVVLLVLYYWRRVGYPIVGVVAATLSYLAALAGNHDSLAFTHLPTALILFGILYVLQVWDRRGVLSISAVAVALFLLWAPSGWGLSSGFVPQLVIVPFASLLLGLLLPYSQRVMASLRMLGAGFAKVPWYAWVILLVISPWVAAFVARTQTVKAYFWVEQRWLSESQRQTMKNVVPVLCKIGLLAPIRVEVEPGVSFRLDPRDLLAVSILRGGAWQSEIWDSLSPNLSEGSVFIDVGAHIGYFSLKAAPRVGKTGRVISFEPNPETLVLLRDNVQANHAVNLTVEPVACTDREQTLTLWAAPIINTGASSLSRDNADLTFKDPPRPYKVRGRPIDDVVRELNLTRVDVIKIDVEGAEVFVLRGTVKTLKRFHPKVVVEVEARQLASMQTTPEELIAIMHDAGYNRSKPVGPTDWEWSVAQ